MIIVNLNIRGVGGGTKAKYLKSMIYKEGAKMVCLQETKTIGMSDARCYAMWGTNDVEWVHNEGRSGAGSLLTMWHKQSFIRERHVEGSGFIAIFGQHVSTKLNCVVVNVYAACNLSDKVALWEALSDLKSNTPDVGMVLLWGF